MELPVHRMLSSSMWMLPQLPLQNTFMAYMTYLPFLASGLVSYHVHLLFKQHSHGANMPRAGSAKVSLDSTQTKTLKRYVNHDCSSYMSSVVLHGSWYLRSRALLTLDRCAASNNTRAPVCEGKARHVGTATELIVRWCFNSTPRNRRRLCSAYIFPPESCFTLGILV